MSCTFFSPFVSVSLSFIHISPLGFLQVSFSIPSVVHSAAELNFPNQSASLCGYLCDFTDATFS